MTWFVCWMIIDDRTKLSDDSQHIYAFFHLKLAVVIFICVMMTLYRGADNSLARSTSRCILFDGENISFVASLVIYINSTNIPPIMIINRIYERQNLLSL